MRTVLKPLTLGELLDRTFFLYRSHFLVFVGIVAMPQLLVLVASLLRVLLQRAIQERSVGGLDVLLTLAVLFASLLVTFIAGAIATGATVVAVSDLYLESSVTIRGAYSRIKGRTIEFCIITFVTGLLIGLGFLAFIVPGILLALRWSLVMPVAVLEGTPAGQVRSRSSALTEGARGRVFAIYALFIVLTLIVTLIWEVPLGVALAAVGTEAAASSLWLPVVAAVAAFFTQCLTGPLLTIATALLYYDQRVRKEAFDIDRLMEPSSLQPEPSPVA